jgi:hypothetical protein
VVGTTDAFGVDPCFEVYKLLAVEVHCSGDPPPAPPVPPPPPPIPPSAKSTFFVDFGVEFQGGLVLSVGDGTAGMQVEVVSAEICSPMVVSSDGTRNVSTNCSKVDWSSAWGWEFTWTLRGGEQRIEQHQCVWLQLFACG